MKTFLTIAIFLSVIFNVNAQDKPVDNVAPKSPCFQKVKGEVRDGVTKELLPNTIISLQTDDGNPVATLMVKKDGLFEFKVNCNTRYRLKASKKTYTLESKNFTTTDLAGAELKTKIFLDKGSIAFIKPNAARIAKSKAKKSKAKIKPTIDNVNPAAIANTEPKPTKKKAVENKVVATAKEQTVAAIDEKPALTKQPTVKKQPLQVEKSIDKTVAENEKVANEQIKAKKVTPVVNETIAKPTSEVKIAKNIDNKDVLVLEPVLFDYESSYLNARAKQELKKIVKIMRKNPDMVLECASYTDAKGPEDYNMWMSKRRAKRTVDFIVKKGINPSRISGKGYGETKLLNNCVGDDDCTDEEREINRRTEFIIIKN